MARRLTALIGPPRGVWTCGSQGTCKMEKLNRSIRKKWAKCRNCDAPQDKYPSSPTAAAREMGRVTLDSETQEAK